MLNKQGQGKIDWTDYTWNPVSGCNHGCQYCYMLRMEKRFPGIMTPAFHENRMKDITGLKNPSKIFVGSSGDMWGKWVNSKWISTVINATALSPKHTFQFLTKNHRGITGGHSLKICGLAQLLTGQETPGTISLN